MVAALDAVRMGTMSINQVTLSVSLIYGSWILARPVSSVRQPSGWQRRPDQTTIKNKWELSRFPLMKIEPSS